MELIGLTGGPVRPPRADLRPPNADSRPPKADNTRGSVFFMDLWSFDVIFSDMLVPWGRLSMCLVPGGVQECRTQVPMTCSWSPLGIILGSLLEPKGDIFKVIF